jgi:sedoheptulokinase
LVAGFQRIKEGLFHGCEGVEANEDISAYEAMDQALECAEIPTDLPQVCTLFQGSRKHPGLRGSITELTPDNFTPVHLMLGLMQGMADELHEMYKGYLAKGGKMPTGIIGSGNGLRCNKHLCRVFETTFGCSLSLSPYLEEAACGAAIYAAQHCK